MIGEFFIIVIVTFSTCTEHFSACCWMCPKFLHSIWVRRRFYFLFCPKKVSKFWLALAWAKSSWCDTELICLVDPCDWCFPRTPEVHSILNVSHKRHRIRCTSAQSSCSLCRFLFYFTKPCRNCCLDSFHARFASFDIFLASACLFFYDNVLRLFFLFVCVRFVWLRQRNPWKITGSVVGRLLYWWW